MVQHLLGQVRQAQVRTVPIVAGSPRLSFAAAETSKQAHPLSGLSNAGNSRSAGYYKAYDARRSKVQ